jgi:hypothetical protein
LPLLERVTIALVAVLLMSAMVGVIKYDTQRTVASQPTTRSDTNSTPTRGAQLTSLSGCAAAVIE